MKISTASQTPSELDKTMHLFEWNLNYTRFFKTRCMRSIGKIPFPDKIEYLQLTHNLVYILFAHGKKCSWYIVVNPKLFSYIYLAPYIIPVLLL